MYGDPQDWQRQMVRNAIGLNGGQRWFNPNGFGAAINKAQNTVNQNFQNPSSDNRIPTEAGERQGIGYTGINSSQFGADYGLRQWLEDDKENGVTNPLVSLARYQMFIEPIVKQARQDELRNAFAVL